MDNPHFKTPFRRDPTTGKVGVVEQDSVAHIESCEYAIAATPAGRRPERPDFGWRWPYMRNVPIDPQPLINVLDRLEPRARDRKARDYVDLADPSKFVIGIDNEVRQGQ